MYSLTIMSHRYGAPAIAKLGWQTRFRNTSTIAILDELQNKLRKIYHFISNLLPYYLAKIKCSTAQHSFVLARMKNYRYISDVNIVLQ